MAWFIILWELSQNHKEQQVLQIKNEFHLNFFEAKTHVALMITPF
jgi:hypothetical protein